MQTQTDRHDKTAELLWEKFADERTLENKNELVKHYIYLVKSIVCRLLPVYKSYSNFDDLLSCGILGLIDAIEKYAIRSEVRFDYYASMRIRGEIIDHMRKQDWAPSSLRRKIQAITNAYSELEKQLGREATDAEAARYLGMSEEKLLSIMEKAHMFNVLHFEEALNEDYSMEFAVIDKGETPEESVENEELKKVLAEVIEGLPEKEKLVITLYYYEELTLKEIAQVLGVSESRVSQIHSKVILKLRTVMHGMFGQ